jgi:membrane fusion protein YbhG
MIKRVVGTIGLIAILAILLSFHRFLPKPNTVSGVIEADRMRLGSLIGGRVAEVLVQEGDRVKLGDLLVRLEPFDLDARKQQANAKLAAAIARLAEMRAGFRPEIVRAAKGNYMAQKAIYQQAINGPRPSEIVAAEGELLSARAALEWAEKNFGRAKSLNRTGSVPETNLDEARRQLKTSEGQLIALKMKLQLLQEGTRAEQIATVASQAEAAEADWQLKKAGYRQEDIAMAEAEVEAAQATIRAIEDQRDELKIVAARDGLVESIDLKPGDLVAPRAAAVSLIAPNDLWIRAFIPETLPALLNQSVAFSVDAWPDKFFHGKIIFIARQAEFTPSNVQTADQRAKLVYRVKVKLEDQLEKLRPGMEVTLNFDKKVDENGPTN